MSARRDRHSIDDEPHFHASQGKADPSEERATRNLRSDSAHTDPTYRQGQSIYDEPDILPGREGETVSQDWTCSACGYNLRGLPLEKGCPECGHRELYRPPPPGEDSYETWLSHHRSRVRARHGWQVACAAAALGGVFAVVTALVKTAPGGALIMGMPLVTILFAPLVEETMKIATASYLIETKPYVFDRVGQIQLATLGSAFVFAVIENLLYLHVYLPNPSTTLILWRWFACTGLHVGATALATRGLVDVWEQTMTEKRRPELSKAFPALIAAILLHGCYNAGVLGWESLSGPM